MSQQIHLIYENGDVRLARPVDPKKLGLHEGMEFDAIIASDDADSPPRGSGAALLRHVGSIPPEDIAEMQKAIDEECGRIDYDGW